MHDVPVNYAGYAPVNYDGEYHGYVTARHALAHSLNVPAVNLYAQLGNDGIYSFLKQAGISTLSEPKRHYGLTLILGSCEVTLLELRRSTPGSPFWRFRTASFNQREWRGLPVHSSKRLLNRGACYLLTEMLTEVRRPDLPAAFEASMNLPQVAWKTGTFLRAQRCLERRLYARIHDWGLGGQLQWARCGRRSSAPKLLRRFYLRCLTPCPLRTDGLRAHIRSATREVCALSGMPVSDHCPTTKVDNFIPRRSTNGPCRVHKQITIDNETGAALCSHCRMGNLSITRSLRSGIRRLRHG